MRYKWELQSSCWSWTFVGELRSVAVIPLPSNPIFGGHYEPFQKLNSHFACLPSHTTFLLLVNLVTIKMNSPDMQNILVQVGTAKMQSTPGTPPPKKRCWAALP